MDPSTSYRNYLGVFSQIYLKCSKCIERFADIVVVVSQSALRGPLN